jgi:hypothetical protein
MGLEHDLEQRLGEVRIGMLALNDGRYPLVNPAAFHYAGGSIWMTTSRYATKLVMAKRDPRVGFVVATRDRSLLFQGLLETYDLVSLGGSLRAALDGPRFAWSMAGYALKNAPTSPGSQASGGHTTGWCCGCGSILPAHCRRGARRQPPPSRWRGRRPMSRIRCARCGRRICAGPAAAPR